MYLSKIYSKDIDLLQYYIIKYYIIKNIKNIYYKKFIHYI